MGRNESFGQGASHQPITIAAEALRRNMQMHSRRPISDVRLEGLRPLHALDDPVDLREHPHHTHMATYSYEAEGMEPRVGHAFMISPTESAPHEVYAGWWRPRSNRDWDQLTGHGG